MKKILLILIILTFTLPSLAFGQSPAQDNSSDAESAKDQIDQIKDKVTDNVERLNLVEKRGLVGVVESVNENQIKINDLNDKIRIIEVDELTKYDSSEVNSFELADIENGVNLSVVGIYNKDSEKLLARFVNETTIPVFLNGVISDIDEDEFTISLTTEDEKNYTVDVENLTKTFSFSEEDLEQSGFSNLEISQNAIVTGFSDPDEENRITATRIVIFPEIPKNPRINVEIPEPTEPDASPTLAE